MSGTDRTFTVDDLIQLPRFDARAAVALGEKLLAAADDVGDLPRNIRRAREVLEEELAGLRSAVEARLASAASADPAVVAEADRTLDACWAALYDWLTGFSKLPDGIAEADEGRALVRELYPAGLSFILLPYELEWKESHLRLSRIANEALGERIRVLGGGVFIDALTSAHKAYGTLLGLPKPPSAKEGGKPTVGEALESFASALRIYALKVTAHFEVDEPETAELSMRLLDPLLHWQVTARDGGDITH